MADNPKVQIDINADGETGALDIAAGQLEGLGGAAAALLGPLAALGTVAGLVDFLKSASDAAEEDAQALVHLRSQLGAAGLDVESSTKTVEAWAESLQAVSRFSAPQLEDALARVVARTGDLEESQKLVQLAMNVSVATGRDFNTELDGLAMAAGGSARGVTMLQREIGQAAVGVTDINELLNLLAARYKDNATQSDTMTDATAKAKNAFHDMSSVIGESLRPAMLGIVEVGGFIAKAFGELWADMTHQVQSFSTVLGAMAMTTVSLATETARISKDIVELNFKDISRAASDGAKEREQIETAMRATLQTGDEQYAASLEKLQIDTAEKSKAAIKSVGDFKGIQGQKDLAQDVATAQAEVAAIKAAEEQNLAKKNQTTEERLAIVKAGLAAELAALDAHHAAWIGKEAQFQAERSKLISEAALKNNQIEQKYVADRIAATEAWRSSHLEVMANMEAAGRQMADGIATSFANSVAKCIVEAKNLQTALHALAIQVAEEIIAQLVRIEVEAAIAKAALLLL